MTSKRILTSHFGDGTHWSGHVKRPTVDFYCVAHDEDYSPKYLGGEFCHDSMDEGYCHPECRRCPYVCPVTPCPLPVEPCSWEGCSEEATVDMEVQSASGAFIKHLCDEHMAQTLEAFGKAIAK
jgi:hypothetical protein